LRIGHGQGHAQEDVDGPDQLLARRRTLRFDHLPRLGVGDDADRLPAAHGWTLWGLSFNDWRDLQFGSLCVCGLLAVEHLVLHWNWVCGVIATKVLRRKYRADQGVEAVYGVGTLIAVLTVMLAGVIAAILTVKQPPM
jgi:hypothetical protein